MNYSNSSSNTCNGTKYVIKKGDTLYSISRRYNVPLALVLRANPYVDVYNLQVGDEICVPGEQNSSVPTRPPVITGPGPVVLPRNEDREQTERRPEMVETAPIPEAFPEEMTQTAPVQNAPMMETPSQSQPGRREIGSRNTLNIHYYNGASAPSDEEADNRMETEQRSMPARRTENVIQRRTQPMTPARPASPARRTTQVRQTVPARRMENSPETESTTETMPARETMPMPMRETMPARETMPMRETMPARQTMPKRMMMLDQDMEPMTARVVMPVQQKPTSVTATRTITKARVVAPVRIITQPDMEDEKDHCSRWNCYQDRERFNTIMYNADKMSSDCCSKKCPSSCTQNTVKPMPCDDEKNSIPIISYICRDDDSLQDILDYFTIELDDLFHYNIPNRIQLKPGCMLQLPGKDEDRY